MRVFRRVLVLTLVRTVIVALTLLLGTSSTILADEIALVQSKSGNLFEIPVRINGAITLNFIIDSGASAVQIPDYLFKTLVAANTIEPADMVGEQNFSNADGVTSKALMFRIRELKIGRYMLQNVPGMVGQEKGPLLLGQSFLSYFDSWTLDNKRHVLRLVGKDELESTVATLPAPRAQSLTPRRESAKRSALVCGRRIDYAVDDVIPGDWRGVWTGNWNNTNRLCGALIVQQMDSTDDGSVTVIYVYGGGGIPWKQQYRAGVMKNGMVSFQDDQGSTFTFRFRGDDLEAKFLGGSGRLMSVFQRRQGSE